MLRTLIQAFAIEVWKDDTDQQIRVGDMTQLLVAHLPSLLRITIDILKSQSTTTATATAKYLESRKIPSNTTVRRWVAEVAPNYARKPGRLPRN